MREKVIEVNESNKWRLRTRDTSNWKRSPRPGKNKYFIISCDTHLNPPVTLFRQRLDTKWHDLLPKMEMRDGARYITMPGARPEKIIDYPFEGEDLVRSKAGADSAVLDHDGQELGLERIIDQKMDVQGAVQSSRRAADSRYRSLDPRGRARRQAGLSDTHPAVQADLGTARYLPRQLQLANVRSAVGGYSGP